MSLLSPRDIDLNIKPLKINVTKLQIWFLFYETKIRASCLALDDKCNRNGKNANRKLEKDKKNSTRNWKQCHSSTKSEATLTPHQRCCRIVKKMKLPPCTSSGMGYLSDFGNPATCY